MAELAPVQFVLLPPPPADRRVVVGLLHEMAEEPVKATRVLLGVSEQGLELRGVLQPRPPRMDNIPPVSWWEVAPGAHPL